MARRTISIDEKIERQKEVVSKLQDKYDAALDELKILMKKRHELDSKELIKGFEKSNRSLDEILAFMVSKDENPV